MPSAARTAFTENKADIDRLWQIHEEVAGNGPGRKHDVEVLNRAAVVLITACWESYVEDVALEGFDYLVNNAPTADKIPGKVQALATQDIVKEKDPAKLWALADTGWRAVLQTHRGTVKQTWVDSLNTPKTKQVDSLFEALLGIRSLSTSWHWKGISAADAQKKLDRYITLRGQIAHRLKHNSTVYKNWSADYLQHVQRLVEKTDDAVAAHIQKQLGVAPW
jgi:hypothetical protein